MVASTGPNRAAAAGGRKDVRRRAAGVGLAGVAMTRWTRRDWCEVGAIYGTIFAITGLPCVALSISLRSFDLFLGWVYFVVSFVAVVGLAPLIWTATVWPVAIVLGRLLGGRERVVSNRDPDRPGFVV